MKNKKLEVEYYRYFSYVLFPRWETKSVIYELLVGIEPLKVKHDVTKFDLTIPLISLRYIVIDLSIQLMSLILYMT